MSSEKLMRLLRERAALPESVELSYQRDGDGTGRAWWDRRHAELEAQGYSLEFETDSGAEWYTLRGIGDELRAALAEYDANAAAQPSPGGQGDALKALDDLAAFCSDDTATVDRHVAVIRAALAASQPVGNYEVQTENGPLKCSLAVYAEWQKNEEYIERLKAELAARQPVGEPDFFMVRDEDESRWRESDEATFDSVKRQRPDDAIALYTAQPAQAVDLEHPQPMIARALAEWHEDDGNVLWWAWCGREWAGEPAWAGTPNDSDWPGYHTHFTPHPNFPIIPKV